MIPDCRVDFYITGTETVEVHFPNGDLACQWCPFCKRKTFRGNTRVICVKTYEPLNEIYETRRGDDCPAGYSGGGHNNGNPYPNHR